MLHKVQNAFDRLTAYCEAEGFKGYDPYDGLTSSFFHALPLLPGNRLARLAWIQAFKRSPVNLRPLLGVQKDYNPKALGLFLSGYCAMYRMEEKPEYLEKIHFFISKLMELATPGWSGACWGYNFDWQSLAFFQPKYMPTIVASTFIGNSLLDAYELLGDEQILQTARSTCDFLLKDLNRSYDDDSDFAFSYSPLDKSIVFNASLLGSKYLARVYHHTGEEKLLDPAKKSVAFCCKHQRPDGSWGYGTYDFHQWVDNFHTGYNLECIDAYMRYSGDETYRGQVEKGFAYYVNTFFTPEGISKYYNNSTYPIDIHAPAQLIITLIRLGKFDEQRALADRVLNWTIDHMQSKQGYFYFQIKKYFTSKIPFMRWAQAWMFFAMSHYLLAAGRETQFVDDALEKAGKELS